MQQTKTKLYNLYYHNNYNSASIIIILYCSIISTIVCMYWRVHKYSNAGYYGYYI